MGTSQLRFGCLAGLIVIMFATSVSGGTLTVQWNHSTDSKTVGYLVSYGTSPGKYTGTVKVGYVTAASVTGLTNGALYYFAVQSYDKANAVGPPSSEVSGRVPTSTGPTITCPSPVLTSLDGKPIAVTLTPTVVGGVTPVSAACSPVSGSLFPVGTTPFTCTAVDAVSQKSSCTSNVVVMASSSTAPPTQFPQSSPLTITCPKIPRVHAGTMPRVEVNYADPVTSGGIRPIEVSCRPKSGNKFPVGQTTVTCEATDAVDATASCTTIALVVP